MKRRGEGHTRPPPRPPADVLVRALPDTFPNRRLHTRLCSLWRISRHCSPFSAGDVFAAFSAFRVPGCVAIFALINPSWWTFESMTPIFLILKNTARSPLVPTSLGPVLIRRYREPLSAGLYSRHHGAGRNIVPRRPGTCGFIGPLSTWVASREGGDPHSSTVCDRVCVPYWASLEPCWPICLFQSDR